MYATKNNQNEYNRRFYNLDTYSNNFENSLYTIVKDVKFKIF